MDAQPRAWMLVAVLLLSACGGGGDGGDGGDTVALSPPTQATIGPAGGTVPVPISEGTQAELEFPAGALRETVSLILTPEAPEPGAHVRVRVEPGNLALAKAVTLRLRGLSTSQSAGVTFYIGSLGDRMFVPTRADPADATLSAQTLLLMLAEAPPLQAAAARPRRLDTTARTSHSGNAGFINVGQMDCLVLLPELGTQIAQASQSGFAAQRAHQLTQTYEVVKLNCAGSSDAAVQAELQLEIDEIEQRACDALTAAVEDILLFTFPTVDEFYGRASRLLGAQGALDSIGASCSPPITMQQAYAKAMSDYIAGFDARVSATGFGGPGWLSSRGELKQIVRLYDDAFMLEMNAEQQAVANTVLRPALAKLHERAFQTCLADNPAEQGQLADLFSGGQVYGNAIAFLAFDETGQAFDGNGRALIPPGIAQDIQYCASSLNIRAYEGAELLPEPALQLGGGVAPGTQVTHGTIKVPVAEGVLVLDGIIRPLLCASQDPNAAAAYDPSSLVIKFNGVTVQTLGAAGANLLPGQPLELDMQALYTAAGLDVNAPGDYPLEIHREGTGCGGLLYGDASLKLFDVTVRSEEAGGEVLLVSATVADGLNLCETKVTALDTLGAQTLEDNRGTNPANCLASLRGGDVEAAASARSSISGPTMLASETPRGVTGLSADASGSVSARATPDVNTDSVIHRAVAAARVDRQAHGELLVQGAPVTMTISGSVAGFAAAGVSWQPSAGGAGEAGSHALGASGNTTPVFGSLSHTVRLVPGQRVRYTLFVNAVALDDDQNPGDSRPSQEGTASLAVTFTP